MPVPIQLISPNMKSDNEDNTFMDYNALLNAISGQKEKIEKTSSKKVFANDKDAKTLVDLWLNGEKDDNNLYTVKNAKSDDIERLKSRGFITEKNNKIYFTNKGSVVLTVMTLGENNKFMKNAKEKKYTEILASMDKRGKPGYRIPKFSKLSHCLQKTSD